MWAQPREIASPQWREACSELWKDSATCLFQIFSVLSALFAINLSHHLSVICRGEDLRPEKKVFWPRRKPRENVTMLTCFSYPVVPRRIKPRQSYCPMCETDFQDTGWFHKAECELQLCHNLFVPESSQQLSSLDRAAETDGSFLHKR